MNRDSSVLPSLSGPILCASGCGFFGNPNTDNLCSKCNAERKQRSGSSACSSSSTATSTSTSVSPSPSPELAATSSPLPSTSSPATPTLAPLAISDSIATATAVDTTAILSPALVTPSPAVATAIATSPVDAPTPKKKLNRCGICTKKVGITYFNCRCDDTLLLCSAHRLPHQHQCTFDLKKLHTANLTKANPEIIKAKMEKI